MRLVQLFPSRAAALSLVVLSLTAALTSQPSPTSARQTRPTPTPAPVRTGRSYTSAGAPRKTQPPQPQSPSPVAFTDITAAARVNFKHSASFTSQKYLLEAMGGGVAVLDFDNDGRPDLFFTNGARLHDPMPKGAKPDKREPAFWNRLYRQKPDATFEDVTARAGLRGEGYSMGAAAADFDDDGFTDLYVTGYGANHLYRNRGDGTFADVTARLGVGGSGWSTSAGWFDYDADGRLDLFVARYMDWDFERGALYCGEPPPGTRAFCHPDNFPAVANLLFRQKPDGTFEDVSERSGTAAARGKGLGVAFADFDANNFTDIFVANDGVRQSLFMNGGAGAFDETALLSGAGYDENGQTFAGMGVDAADYDNDGRPDVFVTALSNETYPLFRNNGDGSFTHVTNTSGVGQITLLYSGWGTRLADFDLDGLRDIFVAQSHVLDTIEKTSSHLTYRQTPLLMRNTGRGFVNVSTSAGLARPLAARGAAFADLDNDGDTDVVLAQLDGPAVVLRNDGARHRWLGLVLVGARSNRQGLGARVTVEDSEGGKQFFDVTTAGSYLSSNDPRVRIGLGARAGVRSVTVRWPGGRKQTLDNPPPGRYNTVQER
ncbi:MAG TPA: CRTAC1 family protein [Pyrinomonadaceae bacterium]|nr:CRTAC1 family protein [Pyrinomonadaceae bacterium]